MTHALIHIRTILFNLVFYLGIALECLVFLPALLLPRRYKMKVVRFFVSSVELMEKYLLGLTYEVRGQENLPTTGAYIVAAKHQSPYETMKLHLLFEDPAIVLKQELLNIPLWGRYLKIIDPIAIDRSQGKKAMTQILEGAMRIKKQGRPIVIFPQGTRVYPWQTPAEKPYKIGVVRIQKETKLPIIPMALNTGVFWPRKSWLKRPGKVVFEFLPALSASEDVQETLTRLQTVLEDRSNQLAEEARQNFDYLPPRESASNQ